MARGRTTTTAEPGADAAGAGGDGSLARSGPGSAGPTAGPDRDDRRSPAPATAVVLSACRSACRSSSSSTAPFITSGLLDQIVATAGGYPYLTVNAYNPWALVTGDTGIQPGQRRPVGLRRAVGRDHVRRRASRCSGPIPAVVVGTALLLAVIVASS